MFDVLFLYVYFLVVFIILLSYYVYVLFCYPSSYCVLLICWVGNKYNTVQKNTIQDNDARIFFANYLQRVKRVYQS